MFICGEGWLPGTLPVSGCPCFRQFTVVFVHMQSVAAVCSILFFLMFSFLSDLALRLCLPIFFFFGVIIINGKH